MTRSIIAKWLKRDEAHTDMLRQVCDELATLGVKTADMETLQRVAAAVERERAQARLSPAEAAIVDEYLDTLPAAERAWFQQFVAGLKPREIAERSGANADDVEAAVAKIYAEMLTRGL